MRYTPLGRSGLNVSVVVPSSANVARAERQGDDLQELVWAIQEGVYTHGFNCFETSDSYGLGAAEVILGRALEGIREQVAIIGSVASRLDAEGQQTDHSPEALSMALEETLRRLGTPYVDVYIVRGVDPTLPAQNLGSALETLRAAGKVRWWGVGGRPAEDLPTLAAFPGFTAWEAPMNLLEREAARGLVEACAALEVGFLALRPLGMGLLAGEYRSRPDYRLNAERAAYPFFGEEGFSGAQHGIAYLRRLAWAHGVTPAVVALAWIAWHAGIPIVNWRDAAQLGEIAGATDLQLTAHEAERLTEAFATPG